MWGVGKDRLWPGFEMELHVLQTAKPPSCACLPKQQNPPLRGVRISFGVLLSRERPRTQGPPLPRPIEVRQQQSGRDDGSVRRAGRADDEEGRARRRAGEGAEVSVLCMELILV